MGALSLMALFGMVRGFSSKMKFAGKNGTLLAFDARITQ
jgi:hypothetical protein